VNAVSAHDNLAKKDLRAGPDRYGAHMYLTPPSQSAPQIAAKPPWLVVGPGLAALVGLFMLTVVYRFDGRTAMQANLHLSNQAMLLTGLVAYVVPLALAFPAGMVLGGRMPTAMAVPAIVLMLLGTLAVAFTPNGLVLLVGRVLGGLGAGEALGVTVALIRGLRTGRGAAAGTLAGLGVLMLAIAPFVGGALSDSLNFRVTYLIGAVVLFLVLIVTAVLGIVSVSSAKPAVPPMSPMQPMPYGAGYPPPGPQYPQPGQLGPQYPQQAQPGPVYPAPGQPGTPYPQQGQPDPSYPPPGPPSA